MTLFHEIDSGYALASGVYLSGEAANDIPVGNKGDDLLSGGTWNDNQVGEDGHDILLGGLGQGILKDRDGGDLEWRVAA